MYGIEQYLVKWAVDTLVKKYVNPATLSMDYVILDEENASCSQVIEACETFSMFSERRVVWVRNFKPLTSDSAKGYSKEEIKELAEYTAGSNDKTILIFSSEEIKASAILPTALKKKAQCYHFDKIDKAELSSFAKKRFKTSGEEITARASKCSLRRRATLTKRVITGFLILKMTFRRSSRTATAAR